MSKEIAALKCLATLLANDFYARTGWPLAGNEPGKHRLLNLWQLALDASNDAIVGLGCAIVEYRPTIT